MRKETQLKTQSKSIQGTGEKNHKSTQECCHGKQRKGCMYKLMYRQQYDLSHSGNALEIETFVVCVSENALQISLTRYMLD